MQESNKKQANTGGKFGDIYTGAANTSPAVLKAQSDKSKADAAVAAYAATKKSQADVSNKTSGFLYKLDK
jgi:hypothetical protein